MITSLHQRNGCVNISIQLAGIYIHIPFCKQACYYCNFHFSTSARLREEMVNSLIKEIGLSHHYLLNDQNEPEIIETIYFGGGTPSLLRSDDVKDLLSAIDKDHNVTSDAEITLEANPDDIDAEKLMAWKKAGITRLSIGIQSFHEKSLRWMNRAHNVRQATESIVLARNAGFENFSIDLIYGTPGLTDNEWKANVDLVIENEIPHISCYALTVEPKTALQKMIALKKKKDIDTTVQANQFELLMKWMKQAGYEHYEISNFCEQGYRSRHNSSYWEGKKYIGIGPSAHSYDGRCRRWNVANNAFYIESLKKDTIPFEEETLTYDNRLNEYIMTSLRTIEGLDLKKLENDFSLNETRRIIKIIDQHAYVSNLLMNMDNNCIALTDKGKLFADGIASTLFK